MRRCDRVALRRVLAREARVACAYGRAESWLGALPDGCADLILTDPPYSSGGMHRGDRTQSTDTKYTRASSRGAHADFEGDTRDQRSWSLWCNLWLVECLRALRPGGSLLAFCDWRQLPAFCDAVGVAGLVLRGIGAWDKTEASRPRPGGLRMQVEYLVHATRGAQTETDRTVFLPGVLRYPVRRDDKLHQTGKPLALLVELAALCPAGGLVLDPFAGSGTTLAAAGLLGLPSAGCELVTAHHARAVRRLVALDGWWGKRPSTPLEWAAVYAAQREVDGEVEQDAEVAA